MSEKLYVEETNCTTGERTRREFTAEEYAQREIDVAAATEADAARATAEAEAAEAKASAISKLSTLGLSDAEIAALVG